MTNSLLAATTPVWWGRLSKRADTDANTVLAAKLAVPIGVLTNLVGNVWAHNRLKSTMEEAPAVRGQGYINSLRHAAELPQIPVVTNHLLGENAAYVDPTGSTMLDYFPEKDPRRERAYQQGMILLGRDFRRPGVISHELGHAHVHNRPWYSPSKWNQMLLRPIGELLSGFAPIGAAIAGAASRNPLVGVGTGLLAGGLTNLPTLINEWQATRLGRDFMERAKALPAQQLEKNKLAQRHAYMTYLLNALVPATVAGGAGGLLSMALKK